MSFLLCVPRFSLMSTTPATLISSFLRQTTKWCHLNGASTLFPRQSASRPLPSPLRQIRTTAEWLLFKLMNVSPPKRRIGKRRRQNQCLTHGTGIYYLPDSGKQTCSSWRLHSTTIQPTHTLSVTHAALCLQIMMLLRSRTRLLDGRGSAHNWQWADGKTGKDN